MFHSRAVGFLMEIVPAIRAIYVVDEPGIGRKPTFYLDRHGESLEMPRDIELAQPPTVGRSEQR